MSRTWSAELEAHFAGQRSTLVACMRITTTGDDVLRFTEHVEDLPINGETFEHMNSFDPGALADTLSFSVSNAEVTVFLGENEQITELDVLAQKLDSATVDVFMVNYSDLSQGSLILAQDWTVGEITIGEARVTLEIRSLAQKLSQTIVELTSPLCRADLGDVRCQVNLDEGASSGESSAFESRFSYTGSVESVTDNATFIDSGSIDQASFSSAVSSADPLQRVFQFGKLTWLTGVNAGVQIQVRDWDPSTGEFTLFEAQPRGITIADTFQVYWGCDKRFPTCGARYGNKVNFQGEPHVPGNDVMDRYEVPPSDF
jgi:uncharacterized phage protein (TIGR02218 family)